MNVVERIGATEARALTDRIKTGVEAVWELIKQAYEHRAWMALGYSSWDDYCTREFGTSRLRLPREDRGEVVASLRESGLSIRAIESATGHSKDTIRRDLYQFGTPPKSSDVDEDALVEELISAEPPRVTGLDGKSYNPTPATPSQPRRKPITDAFDAANYELRRAVERVVRLTEDDRFQKNKDQITGANLSDLVRARDTLAGVIQQLEG